MKDKLKQILIHQLNECKIEPMEYIELNKFIDRMSDVHLSKVFNEGILSKIKSIGHKANELSIDIAKPVGDAIRKMSNKQKSLALGGALGISGAARVLSKRKPKTLKPASEQSIAGAVQSRYPRAINNIQVKIDSLEQARVSNPSLTNKINKKVFRLRAIQNKYRIKQQIWMVKANSRVK
jgi:hypothetical protein